MEGIQIPEIYINSDMILSFDEDACHLNESSSNSNNSPKALNANFQNNSNKFNVNVNVNVNGNVNYSHSNSKYNFNASNIPEEQNKPEFNSKFPEVPKENVNIKKSSDSGQFTQEEISKSIIIDCLLKDQNQFKTENHYVETPQNSNILSFVSSNFTEKSNSDQFTSTEKESNIVRRRRGDPKLCWRCHKRDATPHMRSCEPCRVADRQRWSRRRNLSKIISGKNGANTNSDNGISHCIGQLKDDLPVSLNLDNTKFDALHGGYIQNGIQIKCDNQYFSGLQEHTRTLNAGISHSHNSIPISNISLGYPFKIDQWCDHQFSSLRENRSTHQCTEISQNLSYITISYFPSSFSGLTTLPVSAKFASDGSMNGLETLPSVVLSFIVDKCNEQLLQRQLGRQNHQSLVSNSTQCNSQVESGLGNILISNAEANKNIVSGTGNLGSFHNLHCASIHNSALDSKFYC